MYGRSKATCTVVIEGAGIINYYQKGLRFEATCAKHKNRKTRTVGVKAQHRGRPLGLLAGWLHECDDRLDEYDCNYGEVSRDSRLYARQQLLPAAEGYEDMRGFEKPRVDDSDSEPHV